MRRTQAAAELHVTHSAISQQMRKLEEQVDCPFHGCASFLKTASLSLLLEKRSLPDGNAVVYLRCHRGVLL
ncbi:helix-turn-helix domain-containing protein [Caballeronia sp. KNU42]